jgi:hypothetical protein
MKKIFAIVSALALALVLSGCAPKETNQNSTSNDVASNSQADNQKAQSEDQKSADDFAQWMNKESGVECSIDTDETAINVKTKGGKTRIDETSKDESQGSDTTLNDGQFVYIWSGNEGIKYPSHLDSKNEDSWDWTDDQDVLSDEASQNAYNCKDAEIDDSIFNVPGNVQFSEEENQQ